jgi:hypothetical protein
MTGTTNRTPTHQPQHPDSRRGIRAGRLSRDPMPAQSIMDDAGTGQRGVRCHRGTGWRPDCRPRCDRGYGCVLRVCSDAAYRPAPDGINVTGLHHESGRNTLSTDWPALYELADTDIS